MISSKKTSTNTCSVISALVLAIQMISTQCKKLKYRREIKLLTNATGLINGEDLDQIREKLNEDGIDLTIMYVLAIAPCPENIY